MNVEKWMPLSNYFQLLFIEAPPRREFPIWWRGEIIVLGHFRMFARQFITESNVIPIAIKQRTLNAVNAPGPLRMSAQGNGNMWNRKCRFFEINVAVKRSLDSKVRWHTPAISSYHLFSFCLQFFRVIVTEGCSLYDCDQIIFATNLLPEIHFRLDILSKKTWNEKGSFFNFVALSLTIT